MSNTKRCPQCQAEIPAAAPEGLCPQCLLQAGLQPKTAEAEVKTAPFSPNGSRFEPPTPEALQPAFPQLEILELLGKGGMGAVYKARQPGLDRLVAVKILPPEVSHDPAFAERFTREARALAMLNHPNIVGVYDSGRAGGYYYFVMEYIDGVNLRQAMRAGELKSAEALKIVPQICEALQFAHDEGIVHRDIKPENILLDKKGRVKIADFGLAKLLGRSAAEVSLTGTQQVMGTMHYMAPEQLEGSRDVDHRADIYSLGVTFYEMLTGELPIGRFAAPSKKVQIDVRLDEVVLRSLEKEPELRYQHVSEIKTDVDRIAGDGPAPKAASTNDEPGEPRPRVGYLRFVFFPMALLFPIVCLASALVPAWPPGDQRAFTPRDAVFVGGCALIGLIFLMLNGVWITKRVLAKTPANILRGLVIAGWTAVCIILYAVLFAPADRNVLENNSWMLGMIDNLYWPYRGTSKSAVSLTPAAEIYGRLAIQEDAEVSRLGYLGGSFRPDDRPSGLTKLVYTLELDPIPDAKKAAANGERNRLVVDALNGLSWRYTTEQGLQRSGALLDQSVVAEWLRNAQMVQPVGDQDILTHSRAVATIIRGAADENRGSPLLPFPPRKSVSRLNFAVFQFQKEQPDGMIGGGPPPLAFQRKFTAVDTMQWEPTVPILYVGVPLMLAVWGVGVWLLRPRRRNTVEESPSAG